MEKRFHGKTAAHSMKNAITISGRSLTRWTLLEELWGCTSQPATKTPCGQGRPKAFFQDQYLRFSRNCVHGYGRVNESYALLITGR